MENKNKNNDNDINNNKVDENNQNEMNEEYDVNNKFNSNINEIIDIDSHGINKTFSSSTDKININKNSPSYSKPKSLSKKMKILPIVKDATTPKELLYIIDNYKNINKKIQNDYNRYNNNNYIFNNLSNSNKSINNKINDDLKSKSKLNNKTLSYNEIIKALQE